MTRFADGPACGKILQLRRAPLFLRVVQSGTRTFDALDLLTDEPRPNEKITVYQLCGGGEITHMNYGMHGDFWVNADYKVLPVQPSEKITRCTVAWREWATAQGKGWEQFNKPRPLAVINP